MTNPKKLTVTLVDITKLELDPTNARLHNDENIASIKKSLERFGQRKPIVVQGNVVKAGNGTITAAIELGWTKINVCPAPDDWTQADAEAYAIADNRTAELAFWDQTTLADQLTSLSSGGGFELEDLGFDTTFLDNLTAQLETTSKEIDLGAIDDTLDVECPRCKFRFES